jgi:outer membrane protein TolC
MRRSVDGANLEIDRAVGAYWPTIALQAAYQKQSSDLHGTYGLLGGLDNQSTALVQVVVSLNLFAGGETRAGVEQAELQAHRAQALLDQGEETVVAEVTNARAQVASLTDSLALEQMILDEAEKSLQFARDRLEAGVGSQLEVRDAALKLSQAKLTWVGSLVDLAVARADLNRSVGGSL